MDDLRSGQAEPSPASRCSAHCLGPRVPLEDSYGVTTWSRASKAFYENEIALLSGRRCRSRIPSQLRAQALQQSAESFFVSAIPAPLALLHRVDQARLGEDGHVMRDGWLGEPHAFFNIAGAEAGMLSDCEGAGRSCAALFEGAEDLAPRGIGNGMELVVERCRSRGHRME
jgi:hypothetical protein